MGAGQAENLTLHLSLLLHPKYPSLTLRLKFGVVFLVLLRRKHSFQADWIWKMCCFLLMESDILSPFTGSTEVAKDTAEPGSPHLYWWAYFGSESCYREEKVKTDEAVGLSFTCCAVRLGCQSRCLKFGMGISTDVPTTKNVLEKWRHWSLKKFQWLSRMGLVIMMHPVAQPSNPIVLELVGSAF